MAGGDRQRWIAREVSDGVYRFENANSGKVLDVQDAGTGNGDSLIQWDWWSGDNQLWTADRVNSVEDHCYRIRNANSGRVVDLDGGSDANGTDAQQWEWFDNDDQH